MNKVNATILVVDDEALNLELIKEYLDSANFACECVKDGQHALRLINKDFSKYSCVLLDRMMPEMDGIEVLKRIKSNALYSQLPVIIQTAVTGKDSMREGLEAGAHYYLTKPYDQKMLAAIVSAAVNDYDQYKRLQTRLNETAYSLQMMQHGNFRFKTLKEARMLAILLAKACVNADNVVIGLSELLINAVEHGNLSIGYSDKTRLNETGFWQHEIARRLLMDEYCNKEVSVDVERIGKQLNFTIIDEGEGFDWRKYMEISPERALNSHGRGIAIANSVSFDEIEYYGKGNKVRVKVFNQGSSG